MPKKDRQVDAKSVSNPALTKAVARMIQKIGYDYVSGTAQEAINTILNMAELAADLAQGGAPVTRGRSRARGPKTSVAHEALSAVRSLADDQRPLTPRH